MIDTYSTSFQSTEVKEDQIESLLMESLISRRSVHPRRLVYPGPNDFAIRKMIEAAVTAIDHGALQPWRFISITGDALVTLGELFVEIKLARNSDIGEEELVRERNRAQAVPVIVAIIDRATEKDTSIPLKEQHASLGAAIQNIVLAAHLMGFGAKMVSGKKVTEPLLGKRLGLNVDECVFGFVCIGTSVPGTSVKPRPTVDEVLSDWGPDSSGFDSHASLNCIETVNQLCKP